MQACGTAGLICKGGNKCNLNHLAAISAVRRGAQVYPTDPEGIIWYACPEYARLVDAESWDRLIQRSVVACAQIRQIPEDEIRLLRRQMEQLVENFRVVRLATV